MRLPDSRRLFTVPCGIRTIEKTLPTLFLLCFNIIFPYDYLVVVIFFNIQKMSKRRYECSDDDLSEFVNEYLKKSKYEKSQKLFQSQTDSIISKPSSSSSNLFSKFREFLMKKPKKSQIDDDLGFEINFDAFQSEPKVSQR